MKVTLIVVVLHVQNVWSVEYVMYHWIVLPESVLEISVKVIPVCMKHEIVRHLYFSRYL